MMRIGIEINGVLRNTFEKIKQVYQKNLIDSQTIESQPTYNIDISGDTQDLITNEDFKYEILSEEESFDLEKMYKFQNKEELYSFLYEEYTMEVFGHAPSTEMNTFNVLNEFYLEFRDNYDISIVSNEIGKSKPSSLFFLSKFGMLIEKIFFYSEITKKTMWDSIDVLLTANPYLLLERPENKIVIKYVTNYNKDISSDYEITSLSELKEIIKNIKNV
jgi:hypothetical protein